MSIESLLRTFIDLLLLLALTPLRIEANLDSYALVRGQKNDHCLIRDSGDDTRLECLPNELWLAPELTFCIPAGCYLTTCPANFSQTFECVSVQLDSAEPYGSEQFRCYSGLRLDDLARHRIQQNQLLDSPTLNTFWQQILLVPHQQVQIFLHYKLDDIVEDFCGLASILFTIGALKYYQFRGRVFIPVTSVSYILGHAVGDYFSNKLEDEQEHIHSRHWLSTLASDVVEDATKSAYFVWEFLGFINSMVLWRYGSAIAIQAQLPPASLSRPVWYAAFVLTGLDFIKDSYQFISNYNWIDQQADRLGDEARQLVNELLFPVTSEP